MSLFLQRGKYTLDYKCVRAAETRAAGNPLVAILNFAQNDFGDDIVECQCYVAETSNIPLRHNVTCGIQVTRCSVSLSLLVNITAQFVP